VLGRTLVEVKVTKHLLPLRDEWLNQLLGYVLLDHGDWYELEQVAVFLGRQARLVAWPLAELLSELTGDPRVTLAELRGEFRPADAVPAATWTRLGILDGWSSRQARARLSGLLDSPRRDR
jgi:hypothetical protein